jgi:hypothetical protein
MTLGFPKLVLLLLTLFILSPVLEARFMPNTKNCCSSCSESFMMASPITTTKILSSVINVMKYNASMTEILNMLERNNIEFSHIFIDQFKEYAARVKGNFSSFGGIDP